VRLSKKDLDFRTKRTVQGEPLGGPEEPSKEPKVAKSGGQRRNGTAPGNTGAQILPEERRGGHHGSHQSSLTRRKRASKRGGSGIAREESFARNGEL